MKHNIKEFYCRLLGHNQNPIEDIFMLGQCIITVRGIGRYPDGRKYSYYYHYDLMKS